MLAMNHDELLDVASSIGHRLADQSHWTGSTCTWDVRSFDRSDPVHAKLERAGGSIYQGTSGIAWFLAELAGATSDSEVARAASGGLRHALRAGADLAPAAFGFHSGRVGIAWAAARIAGLLDEPTWLGDAWSLLQPLRGNESNDSGLDVIGGAAGAIPALLDLRMMLERDEPLAMAIRLGDHLIAEAHQEPDGWSWPMMTNTVARHLTGLAHGTSGAGLALLELAHATGEARFRFAAEMAFLYERQFYDPETSNWPDLRNMELSDFTFYEGRQDSLVAGAREGSLPPYELHYMTAWCHGSPGIGLARLRAFELSGHEIFRREAVAAMRSTRDALSLERLDADSFSLCHGVAGNCELLLQAAAVLGEPAWLESALDMARGGWETFEAPGRPWRCGTVSCVSDPSLLLGEAGIGAFYLRLARPETPSPLLLRPVHPAREAVCDRELDLLTRDSADSFFATSRRVTERLTGSQLDWTPRPAPDQPILESPARSLRRALEQRIEHASEILRPALEDAFLVDRARFDVTCAIEDYSEEFVRSLTHQSWSDIDPQRACFVRASDSHLFTAQRDWDTWLQADSRDELPPNRPIHSLLFRSDNRMHVQRLGGFAMLVLQALKEPTDLTLLARQVTAQIAGAASSETIASKVRAQVEALVRSGFVVVAESPASARTPIEPVAKEQGH